MFDSPNGSASVDHVVSFPAPGGGRVVSRDAADPHDAADGEAGGEPSDDLRRRGHDHLQSEHGRPDQVPQQLPTLPRLTVRQGLPGCDKLPEGRTLHQRLQEGNV